MKILDIIQRFDFLGNSTTFTVNKNNFKTTLGGFISLWIFVFYFYLYFTFSGKILSRSKPTGFTTIVKSNKNNIKLNITEDKFLAGFSISDREGHTEQFNDLFYPIFYLELNFLKIIRLKTIKCNELNLSENFYLDDFTLSEYFCPDLSDIPVDYLTGALNERESAFIHFVIALSNQTDPEKNIENNLVEKDIKDIKDIKDFGNFTNKNEIKENNENELRNKERIDKIRNLFATNNVWVNSIYSKVKFSMNNFKKPLKDYLHTEYSLIGLNKINIEEIFFTKNILEDDRGIFFDNREIYKKTGVDKHFKFSNFLINDYTKPKFNYRNTFEKMIDSAIYMNSIMCSDRYYHHFRWFDKIQDIAGNVTGVLELIKYIAVFLYSFYRNFKFESYLCNRLIFMKDDLAEDLEGKFKEYSQNERNEINKKIKDIFDKDKVYNEISINNNNSKRSNKSKRENNNNNNIFQYKMHKSNKSNLENNNNNEMKNLNQNEDSMERSNYLLLGRNSKNKMNPSSDKDISNDKIVLNLNMNKNEQLKEKEIYNKYKEKNKHKNKFVSNEYEDKLNIIKLNNNKVNNNNYEEYNENNENNNMKLSERIEEINEDYLRKKIANENKIEENELEDGIIKKEETKLYKYKSYIEEKINKFSKTKNNLKYYFYQIFIYCISPNEVEEWKLKFDIIKNIPKKINKNFDIFYYFKIIEKLNLIIKSLFSNPEIDLIELMSNKSFKVGNEEKIIFEKNEIDEKINSLKMKKKLSLYLLRSGENLNFLKKSEEELIKNFIN